MSVRDGPQPPFSGQDVCAMCGDPIGPGRRRYCGQGCNDLRYFIFGNSRWKAWQIARDTFGDDVSPSCFQCGLTAVEAAYLHADDLVPHVKGTRVTNEMVSHALAWHPLELDHVVPLWSLTAEERTQHRWWLPGNLQLLCHWCHAAKTKREARERARSGRQEEAPQGAAFLRGSST